MRELLFGTAAALLLVVPVALAQQAGAQQAGAPGQTEAAPANDTTLPWRAAKHEGAGDTGARHGFYDYMARAAGAGPSVPFIGEMAEENAASPAFIGETAGAESATEGVTTGSGSTTPRPAAAESAQPLSDMALARAAVGWEKMTQKQASNGTER